MTPTMLAFASCPLSVAVVIVPWQPLVVDRAGDLPGQRESRHSPSPVAGEGPWPCGGTLPWRPFRSVRHAVEVGEALLGRLERVERRVAEPRVVLDDVVPHRSL